MINTVKVKIINESKHPLPAYADSGSSGMDLRANIEHRIGINPGERYLFPTGIHIQMPEGYEAQIRSRSGLAVKYGIQVLNSPSTIDNSYTGEIFIILHNSGDKVFTVNDGDRIAQLVIAKYEKAELIEVDELRQTERGDGGLGHSGIK